MKTQAEIDTEFNEWFRTSFDACMQPHHAAMQRAFDVLYCDMEEVIDAIQKSFDAQKHDIEQLAKAIGCEEDASGKIITLRKVENVIDKLRTELRTETNAPRAVIRKDLELDERVSEVVSVIDSILAE